MAQNGTITLNFSIGGQTFSASETRTAEGAIGHNITLPAGVAGSMNGTTIVDGLETGHGFEVGDAFDLHYVTVAGVHSVVRGLEVDTANTNDIVFDTSPASEGDALPATLYDVVISVQIEVDTDYDGDLIEIIACKSTVLAMVDIRTSSASKQAQKLAANASWFWITEWGYDNPFDSSVIDVIRVSNGSTSAGVVLISTLYQSVS